MSKSRRTTALATVDRPLFYNGPDPILLNRMETLVNNITSLQREKLNTIGRLDRRRDLDDECGYPKTELDAQQYKELIYREPAASIVNDFFPLESWKSQPRAYEDVDTESETEWDAALNELPQKLNAEPSYYAGKVINPINEFLLRADMLSGYGRHGVIVIGVEDGKDWNEPITPRKNMELLSLHALPEHMAIVTQFETGDSNALTSKERALARKRKGMPTQYQIMFNDPEDATLSGISEPNNTIYVHWSRVVHIADFWHTASPSRIFARPRCSPSLNPILDIRKVRGSSGEIYYKGGFGGHHIGTHPQLGPDVDVNRDEVKDAYEEFINGLQRVFVSSGMTVDPLSPDVTDPTQYILVQMQAIALQMRTPLRILLGNETGERSTTEDRKRHNSNLHSRQHNYITPRIRIPFFDRLINVGVLPIPKNGYLDEWPDIASLSELEQADVLLKKTQAYAAYIAGVEAVVPPIDYMTKFDKIPEDEAQAILDNAADALDNEETHTDPLDEEGKALEREKMQGSLQEGQEQDNIPLPGITDNVAINQFCKTGKGGGIDPTCGDGSASSPKDLSPEGKSAKGKSSKSKGKTKSKKNKTAVSKKPKTPIDTTKSVGKVPTYTQNKKGESKLEDVGETIIFGSKPKDFENISNYTSDKYYKSLNSEMRSCPPKYDCLKGENRAIAASMLGAMKKVPKLSQPVTLYRGMNLKNAETHAKFLDSVYRAHASGKSVSLPSITSTSTGGVSKDFKGNITMKIKSKTGLSMKAVSEFSHENEVVLHPATKYKVTAIEKIGKGHVVHMEAN